MRADRTNFLIEWNIDVSSPEDSLGVLSLLVPLFGKWVRSWHWQTAKWLGTMYPIGYLFGVLLR